MEYQTGHVMTLANSIIGVSVLAMPYCFKQCGIVLSILMLLVSSIISRLACHFLVKSAIIARRKTFEFLAFYIFGAMGKFAIEIGIIGFLIGTCIAFFVVMGDLGPEIIAELTGSYTTNTMRTSILMALALFCVLPLGLLRNVDSLNGVSKATIGFYCCLVLKVVFEAIPHIFTGDWYNSVNFWRPAGILQCLPIFTMALFCQTQLFEIYQALQNATLEKMNELVRVAVNICTSVYIFVGVFGYVAFFQKPFTGNILLSFAPSLMTDVMKIGFILSVAFSFPLVIFPCRASLYSLLYKESYPVHEGMSTYIPESRFKGLTLFIVFISLIIGIMIPNIELVLGLVGSTIGVMICVLFPVTCFICISPKNTNERILAQLMLMIGIFVMVLGTYKNLYSLDNLEPNTVTINSFKNLDQSDLNIGQLADKVDVQKNVVDKIPTTVKILNIESKRNIAEKTTTAKVLINEDLKEVRHEPPQPIEPIEESDVKNAPSNDEQPVSVLPQEKNKDNKNNIKNEFPKLVESIEKYKNESKNDEVDIEAIKKEDKEVEQQEKEKGKVEDTNQVLIDTIQKQNEVQKEFVEQQKKITEEKVKAMKQIENIAREAIEKISGGKDDEKIVADMQKNIKENVKLNIVNKLDEQDGKEEKENLVEINKVSKEGLAIRENSVVESVKKEVERDILIIGPDSVGNNEEKQFKKIEVDRPNLRAEKHELTDIKNLSKDSGDANKNKKEVVEQSEQNLLVKDGNGKPKDKEAEENLIAKNIAPSSNKTTINNTAPLFLKLGKFDGKTNNSETIQNMVPLPLAINLMNQRNKSEASSAFPDRKLQLEERKDIPLSSKEELQVLRRDILSLKSKR